MEQVKESEEGGAKIGRVQETWPKGLWDLIIMLIGQKAKREQLGTPNVVLSAHVHGSFARNSRDGRNEDHV